MRENLFNSAVGEALTVSSCSGVLQEGEVLPPDHKDKEKGNELMTYIRNKRKMRNRRILSRMKMPVLPLKLALFHGTLGGPSNLNGFAV